jgi:hypothetical protein
MAYLPSMESGGIKHPHDTPPHPFMPSPTFELSSNLVERFFNKLKQCRRIATRYDKLAANFLAMVQLASMRLWLRAYESMT